MNDKKTHKALRFEGIVTSIRSRVDGSLGLGIVTPELLTEEKVALMDLQNLLAEMIIMPKDEKDVDMLEARKELVHKSPSQRLRSVIFLLWKQADGELPFEVYYSTKMEQIIDHLKSKLPPISF